MKFLLPAILAFLSLTAYGQGSGQPKSPHETVSTDSISVTYGRPYKNGRTIFGGLEKFGNIWRLGADQATTITFSKDVRFAGQEVPAGTYTLFAIPYENEWTLILNSQLGQWGAYTYLKHKDKDILQVNVPVTLLDNEVEQLTIRFPQPTSMVIEWDKTQLTIPVE